jgi:hypothetical protein
MYYEIDSLWERKYWDSGEQEVLKKNWKQPQDRIVLFNDTVVTNSWMKLEIDSNLLNNYMSCYSFPCFTILCYLMNVWHIWQDILNGNLDKNVSKHKITNLPIEMSFCHSIVNLTCSVASIPLLISSLNLNCSRSVNHQQGV